jgi:hypothetical protein
MLATIAAETKNDVRQIDLGQAQRDLIARGMFEFKTDRPQTGRASHYRAAFLARERKWGVAFCGQQSGESKPDWLRD